MAQEGTVARSSLGPEAGPEDWGVWDAVEHHKLYPKGCGKSGGQ